MLADKYFEALQSRLTIIAGNRQPIEQAARLCCEALSQGGTLHVFDSGHIISGEMFSRAGGLVALSHLTFQLNVNNLVKNRAAGKDEETYSYGYIQNIFKSNQLRKGDVLFVGSVSGKTPNVVELAIQGRTYGLTVIAVTAVEYSSKLVSEHPSGKRLFEVADLVLDNGAPYGDAMLEVEGLDFPICPASGIGAAVVMWLVVASTVEEMLARGLKPTVYPSVNRPNGKELVRQVELEALQKGY